jgi:hypothetical protein
MRQTISTALATNEVMQITGPGVVKVASSSTVAISATKATAVTKGAATAGLITTSAAPLFGFVILVGGFALMVKMVGGYGISNK